MHTQLIEKFMYINSCEINDKHRRLVKNVQPPKFKCSAKTETVGSEDKRNGRKKINNKKKRFVFSRFWRFIAKLEIWRCRKV